MWEQVVKPAPGELKREIVNRFGDVYRRRNARRIVGGSGRSAWAGRVHLRADQHDLKHADRQGYAGLAVALPLPNLDLAGHKDLRPFVQELRDLRIRPICTLEPLGLIDLLSLGIRVTGRVGYIEVNDLFAIDLVDGTVFSEVTDYLDALKTH